MSKLGGTDDDVKLKVRIQKATAAFLALWKIWKVKSNTKRRMFNSNVKLVLLHSAESGRANTENYTDFRL